MFDEKRRLTSTVYLSCLSSILLTVFLPLPGFLKLLLLVSLMLVQVSASIWYSLSYIPYGRQTALRMLRNYFGTQDASNYSNVVGAMI
jgi:hypothetical protein